MATAAANTLMRMPPHLMTLADLSPRQIYGILRHASYLRNSSLQCLPPRSLAQNRKIQENAPQRKVKGPAKSLQDMSIALLFSKRSTRTRVSAETAAGLLGGQALFLGKDDIQLGVNESARDTARVLSGMCQGIFARVGDHSEIEEIMKYSEVPVLNALSSLWHPTQTLADMLTILDQKEFFYQNEDRSRQFRPITISYVGDSANVLHDMLVTYPRMGMKMRVASPPNYRAPQPVWDRVVELGCDKNILWTADPLEAVNGADIVVTDTWISMGQEHEAAQRYKDFAGYQVTEALCKEGGANPDWKFLHCLPRKKQEVDDDVFYGKRSLVFPEADNRKWTIMALFDLMFGKWSLLEYDPKAPKAPKPQELE